MKKPNIIFLMTDQQRWDCIGKFNKHIQTPTIDKLSSDGIIYSQAVCQHPACVPSRNSMMYGLYPSQLGVRSNEGGLFYEDKIPTKSLAEILQAEGYQTAGFGKTHWNHGVIHDKPSTRGFDTRAIGQAKDSGLYEYGALMMSEDNPDGLEKYYHETRNYGPGEENVFGYIGETSKVAEKDHRDGWVAQQCLQYLDEENFNTEKPLFLYLSFLKPHAGFNVPKKFEDMYDINNIPDTQQPPWCGQDAPETHITGLENGHDQWRETWEKLSQEERKRTTLRYWANCTWLDSYFGEVLDKLDTKGILENSIIVYTSDHGDLMGERNHIFRKYCLFESSVRVPLILSGSVIEAEKKGTIDERPAELVDIVPTLTRIAGGKYNPTLPGFDLLSNNKRVGSFSEFHGTVEGNKQSAPIYMWRKKDWKLILSLKGSTADGYKHVSETRGELYNLASDRHEWYNLYYNDAYANMREAMKTELLMSLACAWSKAPFFYDEKGYEKIT